MDSAALFFLCVCVFVCVDDLMPHSSTGVGCKKATVRPDEGTHSPFSAAYTSSSWAAYLLWLLFAGSLPRLPLSHQGNHFLFRKAHSEDPFVWLHVMLWGVWADIHTAYMAAMMLYPCGCLWLAAYLCHLYSF